MINLMLAKRFTPCPLSLVLSLDSKPIKEKGVHGQAKFGAVCIAACKFGGKEKGHWRRLMNWF